MKLSTIATVLVAWCVLAGSVRAQESQSGDFWIPVNVHWSRPHGGPANVTVASTVILYFGRKGVFARDECWVIRTGRSITISNGDPHNESVGSWGPIADGMHMKYRLVGRTVERKGEPLPGKVVEADAEMPRSGLKIGRELFRSITPTNAAEYAAECEDLARKNAGSK
jgi:hypothetical protein